MPCFDQEFTLDMQRQYVNMGLRDTTLGGRRSFMWSIVARVGRDGDTIIWFDDLTDAQMIGSMIQFSERTDSPVVLVGKNVTSGELKEQMDAAHARR